MKRESITANFLKTICWLNNDIVDWASSGQLYSFSGEEKRLGKNHYPFKFDSSITSPDGKYAFIYQKLGTKGLLLKNGELLREINRSYYYANIYEYPVAFLVFKDITYLVHCPLAYNRLDFENVETGKLSTDVPSRNPSDVFHSRLEINRENTFLMSKGWVWHPLDVVEVFNIEECINNPSLLDQSKLSLNVGAEVCTASFINNTKVLFGLSGEIIDDEIFSDPPNHVAVWDLQTNQTTTAVKVTGEFGNLLAINEKLAWDTLNFPKIINIETGQIVDQEKSIFSGEQRSSFANGSNKLPQIIFNRQTKQLAITGDEVIEVLTPSTSY